MAALWRYPVKSLQGERLAAADVTGGGVVGDRGWALVNHDGRVVSGGREPRLLHAWAETSDDGAVRVRLPDGTTVEAGDAAADRALSAWLGYPVRLCRAPRPGPFLDDSPVHLVTAASLRAAGRGGTVAVQRFRPSLLLDGDGDGHPEDRWLGAELLVGAVTLRVGHQTVRCTVVNASQPDVPADPALLRHLRHLHGSCMGVYATVPGPGRVAVGDTAVLVAGGGAAPA